MTKRTDTSSDGKWAFKQFLIAIAAALVTLFILFTLLKVVTRHGQVLTVPSFTNMTYDEAEALAKKNHLRLKITDSVYVPQMKKGVVFKQNPPAGSQVKRRRTIMLSINARVANMVRIPNLVGYSLRQAQSSLAAVQLQVGKLIYVSDIASNNVLAQIYQGRNIAPGESLPAESEIDLRVGLNSTDCLTHVPDLLESNYQQVKPALIDNCLNLKEMIFDNTVHNFADTMQAFVYKQIPQASNNVSVTMGTGVTVYMTLNKALAEKERKYVEAHPLAAPKPQADSTKTAEADSTKKSEPVK